MEFYTRGDKRISEWEDKRRASLLYKSRFDLSSLGRSSLEEIRASAYNLLKVSRYEPPTAKSTARYIEKGTANKARARTPVVNIADYLGGFLGFRCQRYKLGHNGVGGSNPLSLVVHGRRDFDIMVEDSLRFSMVEFVVAHEIGHYILHSSGGVTPSVWPRLSRGWHDAEATVFAGCIVLPRYRIDEIFEASCGSVMEAAYSISELFLWSRLSPLSSMK